MKKQTPRARQATRITKETGRQAQQAAKDKASRFYRDRVREFKKQRNAPPAELFECVIKACDAFRDEMYDPGLRGRARLMYQAIRLIDFSRWNQLKIIKTALDELEDTIMKTEPVWQWPMSARKKRGAR